ncbi:GntR family transcriptional regulator [Microvirga sp. KLBC 81]|uniref:GntR family transcriptional regulator n=1 Tax=Microvirga sp. KLBC 81 TaxID=1862707 RepID=UPI0014033581|nr:GntR family transcriptional regulator [Microvirga sp. KLBC 81]
MADPLQRETVGETAYRRIRSDIVFGRLIPGEKLKLDRISEAYDVSISTLRELLNRLCSEGLAVAEGQRGFEVAPVSAEDFREVAAMRQLLECHALEQSFQQGDLDWESRVVAAYHKLSVIENRMLAGDHSEPEIWKQFDWQFHHALISACGSKVLLGTHAAIYDKYLRYQMVTVVFRGETAANQHQKLLECALARDFATAQQVLIDHIQGCVEDALARETDWVATFASKRASDLTDSSDARGKQVSRRGDRPARARSTSA